MVLSGLKGEIGMSRKSVTANIAQSHIYGQAPMCTELIIPLLKQTCY